MLAVLLPYVVVAVRLRGKVPKCCRVEPLLTFLLRRGKGRLLRLMEQILRGVIVSVLNGVVMVVSEVRVMIVGGCWCWLIKGGQVILGVGLVLWLLVRGETAVTHDSCRVREM